MPAPDSQETCQFLEWDSQFFGINIGRFNGARLDSAVVHDILSWCQARQIDCLYFLADSAHQPTHQLAAANHFQLVDIRVTLDKKPLKPALENHGRPLSPWKNRIRTFIPDDLPKLRDMAGRLHHETRFFFDPGFPRNRSEELYRVWIERSSQNAAAQVFVAESAGNLLGYISCSTPDTGFGQIELIGIETAAQGQGLGNGLVETALDWIAARGRPTAKVVTQGRNIRAQRLYQRCGFLTSSIQFWYHLWSK